MRTIKTTLVALAVLGATVHTALAQINYWTMPPKKFNMTTATPTSTTQGGNGAYSVANAAYAANGATLFYVRDNSIIAGNGTAVGVLPGLGTICDEFNGTLNAQVAIVPVPDACKQYYVIYAMSSLLGGARLVYIKVDASTTTPTMIFNGTAFVAASNNSSTPCPSANNVPQAFNITGNNSSLLAFAVSKVVSGAGATAKRYLYAVNSNEVAKVEITNTGITFVNSTSTTNLGITSADMAGIEAEISWGNTHFAWTSFNGKVLVAKILPNGDIDPNTPAQSYTLDGATGLEFNNTLTNAPKLYATCNAGLKQIVVSTQAVSTVTTTGYSLTNTFLEYGKNGKIYGISPVFTSGALTSTTLVGVTPSTNAITAISTGTGAAMVDSRYMLGAAPNANPFTLPVQLDGENYTYANGNLNLTGFTINNLATTGDCDNGGIRVFCQNGGFAFNPITLGGAPKEYKFTITATCADVNAINYVGAWTTGQPAANFDLGTLTDGAGKKLTNITGFVSIVYSVKDACGVITNVYYLLNIVVPIPTAVALEIYNKTNSQAYLPASQNIATPVSVGTASIGYRINNSTGTINTLIEKLEEYTSAGVYVKDIYNKTTTGISGVSSYTYVSLNNYCVATPLWNGNTGFNACTVPSAGYNGYFSYNNGQFSSGKYYKLTVTLANQCNTNSAYSYLYVNSIGNRIANPTGGINEVTISNQKVSVYPNPATNILNFDWETTTNQNYTLQVTDVLGKVVNTKQLLADQSTSQLDISTLTKGVYLYQIIGTQGTVNGKFIKE
jgi:hypothetical protein